MEIHAKGSSSPNIELPDGSRDLFLAFQFDLPKSSLLLIDNSIVALQDYLRDQIISVIGIDTECPPFAHKKKTALVQLAIRKQSGQEAVFLLDYLKLSSSKDTMIALDNLLLPLFVSDAVIKVGQGLRQDFSQLCSSYPEYSSFRSVFGILETNALHQVLAPTVTYPISLRNLTRNYLHFDLDKSHQLSDWKARPLSDTQIMYAACDALVLLRLYDVMLFEAKFSNSSFKLSEILTTYTHGQSPKRSPKRSHLGLPTASSTGSLVESSCSSGYVSGADNEQSGEGCDQKEQEGTVPIYQKFYSFAERYWYQNELKSQARGGSRSQSRSQSPRDDGIPLPSFEGKRTRFDADGHVVSSSPAFSSSERLLTLSPKTAAVSVDYEVGVGIDELPAPLSPSSSSSSSSTTSSSSKSDFEDRGDDDGDNDSDDDGDDDDKDDLSGSPHRCSGGAQSKPDQSGTEEGHQSKGDETNANWQPNQDQGNQQADAIDNHVPAPENLDLPAEADLRPDADPLDDFLNSSAILSACLAVFVLELHFITVAAHLWYGLSLSDAMISYTLTLLFVTTLLLLVDSLAQYAFHRRRFDHRSFLRSCHLHLCSTYAM